MTSEFKLPELGENIESADVLSVLVKAGDEVKEEQGIIEIETDKATVEVPSSVSGTIKEVKVKEGDKVKAGQTILIMENGEEKEVKGKKESASGGGKEEKEEVRGKKKDGNDKKEDGKSEMEDGGKEKVKGEKENGEEKEEVRGKKEEVKDQKEKSEKKSATGGEIVQFKLPELGENIESADVLSVLVKKGDQIEKDQGVIEIETDKATVEVPSEYSGKVKQVSVKEGDKVKIGQTILEIETSEKEERSEKEDTKKEESGGEERKAKARKGEESEEQVQEQEQESKESKVELEGTKEELKAGEIDNQPPFMKNAAPAAPSVRRLARELGVEIKEVPGTGSKGRISLDDVKSYIKKLNKERSSQGFAGVRSEELPDFSKFGKVERKSMSKIRSTTALHLSYAWAVIPHVTQYDKADITELEKIRKKFNSKIEEDAKLTVTSILAKIISSAIKVFPQFNSSIDMKTKEIIYKKYFNVGIAVDTEHGLIVPVLKDVDRKNIKELSLEITEVAEKARKRKVSLEDLQGACITITNLGGIGGTSFSPIVNSPEVAILGVSRGSIEPVYKDGEFIPRLMLPLSLSYDHRIIDGADAVRFLRWVCEALEQPFKIMVDG